MATSMTEEQKMIFMANANKNGINSYSEKMLYNQIQLERDIRLKMSNDRRLQKLIGDEDGLETDFFGVGKLASVGYDIGFNVLQELGLFK
jgi:hypothetical protein